MATRISITQVANFDVTDKSNLPQWWKKWTQSFEFYLTASGTDNDWQMWALLFHSAGLEVQEIFLHLEKVGTTYKAAIGWLKQPLSTLKESRIWEAHLSPNYSRDQQAIAEFCHKTS